MSQLNPKCLATTIALPLLTLTLLLLTGCQPYSLQGRVIEGPRSYIAVVDANDQRLAIPYGGVPNAEISLILDPTKMNRIVEQPAYSGLKGIFELPVQATGAGFLKYDALITITAEEFVPVEKIMPLPGSDKRLLIVLKSGTGKLNRPNDFLEDTMKKAKPYLNN